MQGIFQLRVMVSENGCSAANISLTSMGLSKIFHSEGLTESCLMVSAIGGTAVATVPLTSLCICLAYFDADPVLLLLPGAL